MSDLVSLALGIIALVIAIAAYFVATGILFSRRIARIRAVLDVSRSRAFWVGLINICFFGVIALAFAAIPDFLLGGLPRLIALLVLAVPISATTIGLGAIVHFIGAELTPEARTWQKNAAGAACLSLACAVPFIGWFFLLPYVSLVGLGGFILSIFIRDVLSE